MTQLLLTYLPFIAIIVSYILTLNFYSKKMDSLRQTNTEIKLQLADEISARKRDNEKCEEDRKVEYRMGVREGVKHSDFDTFKDKLRGFLKEEDEN